MQSSTPNPGPRRASDRDRLVGAARCASRPQPALPCPRARGLPIATAMGNVKKYYPSRDAMSSYFMSYLVRKDGISDAKGRIIMDPTQDHCLYHRLFYISVFPLPVQPNQRSNFRFKLRLRLRRRLKSRHRVGKHRLTSPGFAQVSLVIVHHPVCLVTKGYICPGSTLSIV